MKTSDSKGVAALILGKPKEEAEAGEGADPALLMAAEDCIAAMKAGDAEGFASAMKAFVEMCSTSYEG